MHGPSGPLLSVASGTDSAQGTLYLGSYGLNASAMPRGNTDPDNLGFDASADLSGTINITC
jgi:hypothetical protein